MSEDWRPTCGEAKKRVWVDRWENDDNLPANAIDLQPDSYAVFSSSQGGHFDVYKSVSLTKELWFALLLARHRDSDENGHMSGNNVKTGKFILEYIKGRKT